MTWGPQPGIIPTATPNRTAVKPVDAVRRYNRLFATGKVYAQFIRQVSRKDPVPTKAVSSALWIRVSLAIGAYVLHLHGLGL